MMRTVIAVCSCLLLGCAAPRTVHAPAPPPAPTSVSAPASTPSRPSGPARITAFARIDPFAVQPGVGVGKIRLGMDRGSIAALLGPPKAIKSSAESRREYEGAGYSADQMVVFSTGFDVEETYDLTEGQPYFPVYSLYWKNKRLVHLILTSYGYSSDKLRAYSIQRRIRFGDRIDSIAKELGAHRVNRLPGNAKEYLFDARGISFVVSDGVAKTMEIFPPRRVNATPAS